MLSALAPLWQKKSQNLADVLKQKDNKFISNEKRLSFRRQPLYYFY
jgi:hypothetical protein